MPSPTSEARSDPASSLKEKEPGDREKITVAALTPEEQQAPRDIDWAQSDPAVQAQYYGKLVVPYGGAIVASGDAAAAVLAEAARVTGRRVEELPLVGIVDPLLEIPH
jgi:hypothetical protein